MDPISYRFLTKIILFLFMLVLTVITVLKYYVVLSLGFLQFHLCMGCLIASIAIYPLKALLPHFLSMFFLPSVSHLQQHSVPIFISVFFFSIFLSFSSLKPILSATLLIHFKLHHFISSFTNLFCKIFS